MKNAKFSRNTLKFLEKASRQKREDWLERNRAEYEKEIVNPLTNLARHLKSEIAPLAPDYNFPQKGLGRIKRSADKAKEYGSYFKDWITYSAARPRTSRFDHNPNLFFLINPEDRDDPVLVAGGLYMPSSRQLRKLRETIAEDDSAFKHLFASKSFSSLFPGGFSTERKATRPPRGFDPNHPRIEQMKLQAFFVWKPYSMKQFTSAEFPEIIARDWKQILRLNRLLEQALEGRPATVEPKKQPQSKLLDRLASIDRFERKMDF